MQSVAISMNSYQQFECYQSALCRWR